MDRSYAVTAGALVLAGVVTVAHYMNSNEPSARLSCDEAKKNPAIIMCDDFEAPGFERRWDIGGHQGVFPISEFVTCGGGVGFGDRCAAWSNRLSFDREWGFYGYDGRSAFPAQPEFYVRWYQYISSPYAWGPLEDKSVMLHDADNSITAYVATNRNHRPVVRDSGPGMPYVANYQDVDVDETSGRYTMVNRFQNQRRNVTLQPGRWYFFEWYVKLNTPGKSDGVTKLWVDDASRPIETPTLRLAYDDMRWRRARDGDTSFSTVRLTVYHQRCDGKPNTCPPNGPWILDQFQRWDHVAISTKPVGPWQAATK
jgi:hypothetical protein